MSTTELTPASLQVGPREVEQELARLDASDPAHRAIALEALEALVKDYILPAMNLPLSQTRFDVFDLNAVAGEHVPGLVLSLFDEEMPGGLRQPSDEQLKKALAYIGLETLNGEQRSAFLKCWTANKASLSIRSILNFLREPLLRDVPSQLKTAAPGEERRLSALLEHTLPEDISYQLSMTIKRLEQLED